MAWNVKIFNFSDQVTNIIMRYVCFVFNNLLLAIFKLRKYFLGLHRWLWQCQFQSVGPPVERKGRRIYVLLFLNYYSHLAFSSHACVHSINVKWFLGPVFISIHSDCGFCSGHFCAHFNEIVSCNQISKPTKPKTFKYWWY